MINGTTTIKDDHDSDEIVTETVVNVQQEVEPQIIDLISPKPVARPGVRRPSAAELQAELKRGTAKPKVTIDPSIIRNSGEQQQTQFSTRKQQVLSKNMDDIELGYQRKLREYEETMAEFDRRDEINRTAVAEGLAMVEGEIKYMPGDNMKELDVDGINFDDDIERELDEAEKNAEALVAVSEKTNNVRITNSIFGDDELEENIPPSEPEVIGDYPSGEPEDSNENYEEDYIPVIEERIDPIETPEIVQPVEEETHSETSVESIFGNRVTVKPAAPVENTIVVAASVNDFDLDPTDFEDLDSEEQEKEDEASKEEEDRIFKRFKSDILAKIVNTADRIDVSTFKVAKKVASYQEVLNKSKSVVGNEKFTATWALMNAGRPFIASSLTGPEIVMLYESDETNNAQYQANIPQLKILYNHDMNPYKPTNFNAWAKSIPYHDISEIFMAIYAATFTRGNYIPYSCGNQKCKNLELQDIKDIRNSMVKFFNDKDGKAKEKFDRICNTTMTPEMSVEYETVIIPINNYIAIGFKLPSLYSYLIELRSVPEDFLQKYSSVVYTTMFIDTIYNININTEELEPIQYKQFPNDISKDLRSKISTYARILNMLSTGEFNILMAYINSVSTRNELSYVIPERKCSRCGYTIEEAPTTAKDLVFTQPQLVNIATISGE